MEPNAYWLALRKRWIVIVVLTALGAGAAYAVAQLTTPLYRSTSSLFVSSERGNSTSDLLQGSTFSQNLVQSYSRLATMPAVLQPVIDELDLEVSPTALARSVSAQSPLNTVIIEISATSDSPAGAKALADAVSVELAKVASDLSPKNDAGDPSITLQEVSAGEVPRFQFFPSTPLFLAAGAAAGFALAVVYALLRQLLDRRLRDSREIERLGAGVLAAVPEFKSDGSAAMISSPHGLVAEEYRRLRTNIEFSDVDEPVSVVLVTSGSPSEGKSTVALNLALALGERTRRVLLIDADLRLPSLADYCRIDGSVGLTSVLLGSAKPENAIQPWAGRIDVLPSGLLAPNPNQLLASKPMTQFMTAMGKIYDFIVIDSAPVLPTVDALTLARLSDGVVVVARARRTRRDDLARVFDALRVVNTRMLGVAFNRVKTQSKTAYYGNPTVPIEAEDSPEAITTNVLKADASLKRRRARNRRSIMDPDATSASATEAGAQSEQVPSFD